MRIIEETHICYAREIQKGDYLDLSADRYAEPHATPELQFEFDTNYHEVTRVVACHMPDGESILVEFAFGDVMYPLTALVVRRNKNGRQS